MEGENEGGVEKRWSGTDFVRDPLAIWYLTPLHYMKTIKEQLCLLKIKNHYAT